MHACLPDCLHACVIASLPVCLSVVLQKQGTMQRCKVVSVQNAQRGH